MNDILPTILKDTYTISQLRHKISVLKQSFLQHFFSGQTIEINQNHLKFINKDNVYQVFDDLEKEIAKFIPLTIYLTFEPDEATLTQIGQYGRKIFGPSLLFDVKYDPRLIAGAALVWKGVYRDYSLRSKIEERKMLILDTFKKFLQ